jgi:hypothetical protein
MEKEFKDLIRSNIDRYGYHITIVDGVPCPRFAYTIGLSETIGFELVFSGGYYYLKDDLFTIFNKFVEVLSPKRGIKDLNLSIGQFGEFSLREVGLTWGRLMLLGVFDYYKVSEVNAFQIIPSSESYTIDIPDMKLSNPESDPIWKWLKKEWDYPVPITSGSVTDIGALRGKPILEITRWEEDEWEMFSTNPQDVDKEKCRVVPIGVLLGYDASLEIAFNLKLEKGAYRSDKTEIWQNWG